MNREEIEKELGKLMHKISKQQNVVQKENKKLQELQAEANWPVSVVRMTQSWS